MPGEFGQIASYAVGIKMVLPNGELFEVDESDPELLQLARSSYGLFGIVYEATFRVRQLAAMEVHHEKFTFDEFARAAARAATRDESMMLYINPFKDTITVEFRRYHETSSAGDLQHLAVEAAQRGLEPPRPAVGAQRQPAVPLEVDPLGADRLLQRADRARPDQGDQGQGHAADRAADPLPGGLRQRPLPVQHLGVPRGALHRLPAGLLRASPRSTTSAPATGSTCSASATASSPTRARCSPTASTAR